MSKKKTFDFGRYLAFIFFSAFLALLLVYTDAGRFLRTSIVDVPEHQPFDGTVYPFQKIPNWLDLSTDEWDMTYSELNSSDLLDAPFYDPSELSTSTDALKWGDIEDDAVRTAKITYPVPYMGNYQLDGLEYAGSHLAVDVKIPTGTPIFSAANGTVIKAVEQNSGFGYHLVVQTNNAPSPTDPDKLETLYFSYSHLSSLLVKKGDIVSKGQQIALSGESGTATTPHLHFQLDNSKAPWHPFWPFTNSEAYDAGYGFFEAINAGLGKAKAIETTYNPMKYVQAHLDGNSSYVFVEDNHDDVEDVAGNSADSYISNDAAPDEDTPVDIEETTDPVVVETPAEEPEYIPELADVQIEVAGTYYVDSISAATFQVRLVDQKGNTFEEGFAGEMLVRAVNGDMRPSKTIVTTRDFNNGILVDGFAKANLGQDKIEVVLNGETYKSDWFDLIGAANSVFTDVPSTHPSYQAISYLVDEGIIAGYPDGSFKPNQVVSRVEAIKMILEGIKAKSDDCSLPFSDTSSSEWYGKYLCAAYTGKIVNGYPDGSFKPGSTVNKAEFYKILFNSMGVDVTSLQVTSAPFKDVPVDAWFAPFISKAKSMGVIETGDYFRPEVGMKRSEVAEAIFKVMTVLD